MPPIAHRITDVAGFKVFYREAGRRDAPVVLLLHGFPTSSHMFRGLIPVLADSYRVIAPDLPGFGFTDAPDRARVAYTFEHLAEVVDRLTEMLGLARFAIFVFDYGAPVGFRLALKHPERITAIISQNGNAYEEGLSEAGIPSRPIGASRPRRIVRRCATSSSRKRQSGNTPMASRATSPSTPTSALTRSTSRLHPFGRTSSRRLASVTWPSLVACSRRRRERRTGAPVRVVVPTGARLSAHSPWTWRHS
jgi:pimeloyl-ACP methyl ester carboxylesterase